nr:hypothetical protein [Streptomyces sp. ISL-36]
MIGELVIRDDEFRLAWAKHNVRLHHIWPQALPPPAERQHATIWKLTWHYAALSSPRHGRQESSTVRVHPAHPAPGGLTKMVYTWHTRYT